MLSFGGGASELTRRLALVRHLLRQRGPKQGAADGTAAPASAAVDDGDGLLASESLAVVAIGWASAVAVALLLAAGNALESVMSTAGESLQEGGWGGAKDTAHVAA